MNRERIRLAIENDPYLPFFMRTASRIDSILESPQQIRIACKGLSAPYVLRWDISDLIGEEELAALFAAKHDLILYRLCKYLHAQFSGRWVAISGTNTVVADVDQYGTLSHGEKMVEGAPVYLEFIP